MDKIKDGLKHEMDEFGAATGLQGWQVMALVVILVILVIGLCGWCVFRFFRKKRKAKKGELTRGYENDDEAAMVRNDEESAKLSQSPNFF